MCRGCIQRQPNVTGEGPAPRQKLVQVTNTFRVYPGLLGMPGSRGHVLSTSRFDRASCFHCCLSVCCLFSIVICFSFWNYVCVLFCLFCLVSVIIMFFFPRWRMRCQSRNQKGNKTKEQTQTSNKKFRRQRPPQGLTATQLSKCCALINSVFTIVDSA